MEKRLNELIHKETNKKARKYHAKLKEEISPYTDKNLNEIHDDKKKEFKDEINDFLERFMKFSEQKKEYLTSLSKKGLIENNKTPLRN